MNSAQSTADDASENLPERLQQLEQNYQQLLSAGLRLDLTRGKPCSAQLELSNAMDSILDNDFRAEDGTDCRNYGGGLGIPEARRFAAQYLGCAPNQVLVGGNSSLQLMYQCVLYNHIFGTEGAESWQQEAGSSQVKFLCPTPGYDRHFAVCEALGIDMVPVRLTATGPDMDMVEDAVKSDPLIKGIWCVPKYSNPSGIVYSAETVQRLARLGLIAGKNFRIIWDNAYAAHHLVDDPPQLSNILELSADHGTLSNVIAVGSTSKITFAGAGLAFLASSQDNIQSLAKHLSYVTIGPDKINQLRHIRFLKDMENLAAHMEKHRQIIGPKFTLVLDALEQAFGGRTLNGAAFGHWTIPQGGYFILFDTLPGLADQVVSLASEAGVKLTPAGATWPYGNDPDNTNIRLAPTFPDLDEIQTAMEVFTTCVELATLRQAVSGD